MSALAAELDGIDLGDQRLNRRARRVLAKLGEKPTVSIPAACGGWRETRAAYRLFDHDAVTAEAVLAPHIACTVARMGAHPRVLCIEDTSELDYTGRPSMQGLGPLNLETRQGLYLHPTLAVTPERLCLGLLNVHRWVREPGSLGQDKDPKRALEEKESVRWVDGYRQIDELAEQLPNTRLTYVADREADIYDLFVEAPCPDTAADWLVRGQHDRVLADGKTLRQQVAEAPVLAATTFERPASHGCTARTVHQELRAVRITLPAPRRPDRTLPAVEITALLASEPAPPTGEEPVVWLLLTNLPVDTPAQALEKLQWYLCRWQIEVYFRILKSGCRIEKLQLEKRERLEPALACYMIVAWRVLFLTMLGRECPDMPCDVVFETAEWHAVYIVTERKPPPDTPPTLDRMVRMIAGLGGFLNRKSDGFPGPQTLWIGLQRAADFVLAMEAQRGVGDGRYG
ncbi:IS4 family transposase [Candidatus Thiodictyon syntrophicum]|uniref:Transposase n=1 Tax=Candidatus Thiodictyon syntrophicum TaxID=1166950 RepID=A0A2K8UFY9_9GAMM|nr:IS4 family transposase [Candidatus Thiodictyon syntrophicum]AUB80004.1 transposase [Candidatus Thiodictyon syntrophicum]AUB84474.1 transposase [Candidatus Thiodictyon syntrophicum]